jgi:hypothetical protein
MQLPRKLVAAGVILGLFSIGLGVAGIVTPSWLSLKIQGTDIVAGNYSLFRCNNIVCANESNFRTVQILIIAGVAAIAAGVFIALILDILTKNQWIQLLPQIFLFAGPTLIFVGLLLYAKYVFEDVGNSTTTLSLDYSIIVIIVGCLLGFLTATYFSFAAGSRHSQVVQTRPHSSAVIPDRSERF